MNLPVVRYLPLIHSFEDGSQLLVQLHYLDGELVSSTFATRASRWESWSPPRVLEEAP